MEKIFHMVDIGIALLSGLFIISFLIFYGFLERLSIFLLGIHCCYFIMKHRKWSVQYVVTLIIAFVVGIISMTWWNIYTFTGQVSQSTDIQQEKGKNTAVLLVMKGEPEYYDISLLLEKMDRTNKFSTSIKKIKDLYQYKRAYEISGASQYNTRAESLYNKLAELLNSDYDLFLSFMDSPPYYEYLSQDIFLHTKYEKVIIVPLFLTESTDYAKIIENSNERIQQMGQSNLRYTQPLWSSDKLVRSMIQETERHIKGYGSNNLGIILMSNNHGIKKDLEVTNASLRQEMLFMENIKRQMIKRGYEERKIKFVGSYLPNKSLSDAMEELQQYGVGEICIVSISDFIDNILNVAHVEKKIKEMDEEKGYNVVYIKGWGDTNLLVEELENRIRLLKVEE
ncbi:MAG: hypothetical protein AB2421_13425 [Thermotaleaceae bacterium]